MADMKEMKTLTLQDKKYEVVDEKARQQVATKAEASALEAKQDKLEFDEKPTESSDKPVKSGGIKTAIDEAVANVKITMDEAPTAESENAVKSKGIKTELDKKADKKVPAAAGNVATLDVGGNLADGGKKYAPVARSVNMNSPVGVAADGTLWSHSTTSRLYTVRWDKTTNTMTRLNSAEGITTTTTNFCYNGTVNEQYNNPFDNIYPWSGIKLCNIDIDAYVALKPGARVTDCVVAWEGDPDFKYDHENGVWRYSPEFWGRTWDDETYRYFEITDQEMAGYIYYPESIEGRWHGVQVKSKQVSGQAKDVLLPLVDKMPAACYAISTMHTEAKNYGATLGSIYTVDKNNLLYVVEYADMNAQNKIGQGVSNMYHAGNVHPVTVEGNTVTVLGTDATNVQVDSIIGFQNASGDTCNQGRFIVTAITDESPNKKLTLSGTPSGVTTASFWGLFGKKNTKDDQIGSKSGYIGTNGKSIAYYRGMEMYGNMYFYTLGAYREKTTNHVWAAKSIADADAIDALNKEKCRDTNCVLPVKPDGSQNEGYIKKLGMPQGFAAAPICVEVGGDSTKPVGDYCWTPASTANDTILILGANATFGLLVGPFAGLWHSASSNAWWNSGARPALKIPQ